MVMPYPTTTVHGAGATHGDQIKTGIRKFAKVPDRETKTGYLKSSSPFLGIFSTFYGLVTFLLCFGFRLLLLEHDGAVTC